MVLQDRFASIHRVSYIVVVSLLPQGLRHMLKYSYWRTEAPTRDWIHEPNFDFQTASYVDTVWHGMLHTCSIGYVVSR